MASPATSHLTVEDFSFLQARLMWCYEAEVIEENRRKFTAERHIQAWLMLSGTGAIRTPSATWTAEPGHWLFGTTQPHHQEFSNDARILSINFKMEWPSGDSLIDQPLVVRADDFPDLARAARPLLRFIRRHFPGMRNDLWGAPIEAASFFELHQIFSRWMVAYLHVALACGVRPTRMAGLDARVLSALRILDQHPWAVPFRENDLAHKIGLSTGYLDCLFIQQMGLTPRAYLQKRRFESASALLADLGTPIKKIAYDLGFSSPGHFSHWFRKAGGQSPREFRDGRSL